MRLRSVPILLLFLSGCTTLTYRDGDTEFRRTAFATGLKIQAIEVVETPQGKRIIMQGADSDAAATARAIAEGVAKGMAIP